MKLLVLSVLLAFASSANVPKKRAAYYPNVFYTSLPYLQPVPVPTAIVELKGEGSEVSGRITFTQPQGGPVIYTGNVTGLSEGLHGFHIHEFGDVSKDCKSVGAHFNPGYTHHGGPADPYRHIGDLGNIKANAEGLAQVHDSDHLISLHGHNSIIGRSLVISANKDDYGRGGDKESLRTGNSGDTVACGAIVWIHPVRPKPPQEGESAKPEGGADTEIVEP
ncbi:unnamed protein product [Nezara viridula]|uniref:superoxide dismutase n=1 Tax=Nezara viridula TaxID=85310 RepID=A0A9P0HQP0_NEZVI|nr:unnamed protein product [Nezara viridula]